MRSFIHPPHKIIHPSAGCLVAWMRGEHKYHVFPVAWGTRSPRRELGPYSDDAEEMSKGGRGGERGALVTWYGLRSNY